MLLRRHPHFLKQHWQLDVQTDQQALRFHHGFLAGFLSCINSGINTPTSTANATVPAQGNLTNHTVPPASIMGSR